VLEGAAKGIGSVPWDHIEKLITASNKCDQVIDFSCLVLYCPAFHLSLPVALTVVDTQIDARIAYSVCICQNSTRILKNCPT